MKKVLSMVLVLAMMLSLVTVASVTSTAATATQGALEEATGAKDPGVIKTEGTPLSAETLATQLAAGGTYHMTGDIDASAATGLTVATGTTIYGNGYTLKLGASLAVAAGTATDKTTVKFENIKFDTTTGVIDTVEAGDISFTDCTRIGEVTPTFGRYGGYICGVGAQGSTTPSKVTFTNCINSGNVKTTGSNYLIGGFIGGVRAPGSEVTFDRCTNAGEIYSAKQQVGGFIGSVEVTATVGFNNCINDEDALITGEKWAGGFIGRTIDGAACTFKNCENRGRVATHAYEYAGGFLGEATSGSATFENCTNSGEIEAKKSGAGGFIARPHTNSTAGASIQLSFTDCANSGTISAGENGGGFVGDFMGTDGVTGTTASFTNCTNSGDVSVGSNYAGGFAAKAAFVSDITFQNCHNAGNVEAKGSSAAGFIGRPIAKATFTNCKNSGDVSAPNRFGSFAGFVHASSVINLTNCINTGYIAENDTFNGTTRAAGDWVGAGAPAANLTACANTADDVTPTTAPKLFGTLETIPQDGKQKVRFVGVIDSLKYDKVGFKVTSQVDGGTVKDYGSLEVTTAYLSVKAGDKVYTASDANAGMGTTNYEYVYALTFKNVPTTGKVVFTVQAYGVVGEETLTDENIWTITYENGSLTGAIFVPAN